MLRNYITEPDFFRHPRSIRLVGGRVERVGHHDQYAVVTIPVRSLSELEPFTLYDLVIRRAFPPEAKGLPLKFKAVGHIPLDPAMYTGYSKENQCRWEHGHRDGITPFVGDGVDGVEGVHVGGSDCDVEVITEHIPAQVYDAVMWGYGNQATLNDIILRNDEPLPFIRLYLNDKGEFVIMPFTHCASSRPKRLLVRQEEIIKEPFRAHTLAINERATEFVHPRRFERTQLWTEGAWGGCCGHGRGRIW